MFKIDVFDKKSGLRIHPNDLGFDGFMVADSGILLGFEFPCSCEIIESSSDKYVVSLSSVVRDIHDFNLSEDEYIFFNERWQK